jgi:hypothetical protein
MGTPPAVLQRGTQLRDDAVAYTLPILQDAGPTTLARSYPIGQRVLIQVWPPWRPALTSFGSGFR